MHPLLQDIKRHLEAASVDYTREADGITVPAANDDGFPAGVTVSDREAIVFGGNGWHMHFQLPSHAEHAALLFMLMLTDAARLKVTFRGDQETCWTLETRVYGRWGRLNSTARLHWWFLRRRRHVYFQNSHVAVRALVPWIPERFAPDARNREYF